jgi:microcystin-dependent protein
MSDQFVAEIRIFAGNFAPKGWAFCNGQLLPISQNTALFSLLGTTYGGDGKSTFGLPNLQGSAPLQQGQGPGLTLRDLGETGGSSTVSLLQSEIPAHSHAVSGTAVAGTTGVPAPTLTWAASATGRTPPPLYFNGSPNASMSPGALSNAGGDLPHNNMQPFLGLTFIIALQGIFPPRS